MKVIKYDDQLVAQIEYFDFLINNLNVESLIHGYCSLSRDWIHEDITSPFHRLYFILSGSGTLKNTEQTIPLLPGHIYLIPANSTWTYLCEEEMEQFFVHIKITLMKGLDLFQGITNCLVLETREEEITNMVKNVETGSLKSIIRFKSRLFEIIAKLIEKNQINLKSHIGKILKYQDLFIYIENNRSANLKVSDVVDFMKQSHSALYKDLKAETGYSIKYYLDKSLVDASCESLLLTDLSIKEIAHSLDFKDQYYFSRFFKKHIGTSPSTYRTYNEAINRQFFIDPCLPP
jgi:AraC-like DNA-binding protein